MSYTVGQVVGIFRSMGWGTNAEGKYTVTKVNKVRIELTRAVDGYVRTFSVKTGHEMGSLPSDRTYVVTEDRYDQQAALLAAEALRKRSINDIKNAAEKLTSRGISADEIATLRALLDKVEQFVTIA